MKARNAPLAIAALGGLLLVGFSFPAWAHKTSLKTTLIGVVGTVSPIKFNSKTKSQISLSSSKGGKIKFKISNAVDAMGNRITAAGNNARLDVQINGVPQSISLPFDLSNGKGKASIASLNLVHPDIIIIEDIELTDSNGDAFGTLGFRIKQGP